MMKELTFSEYLFELSEEEVIAATNAILGVNNE